MKILQSGKQRKTCFLAKQAFTLIELLVAIGVLGIAIATATGIFFSNIRSKRKTNSLALIRQSGDYTLLTMATKIRNAEEVVEDTYACVSGMSHLEIRNRDGTTSLFSCTGVADGNCTSNIGSEVVDINGNCLTNPNFSLSGCSFDCDKSVIVGNPPAITINFTLTKGSPASILDYANQTFSTTISLRNY